MQVQSTVCGGSQRGEWKQDGNLSSGCKGGSIANAVGKKEIETDQRPVYISYAARLDSDRDSCYEIALPIEHKGESAQRKQETKQNSIESTYLISDSYWVSH